MDRIRVCVGLALDGRCAVHAYPTTLSPHPHCLVGWLVPLCFLSNAPPPPASRTSLSAVGVFVVVVYFRFQQTMMLLLITNIYDIILISSCGLRECVSGCLSTGVLRIKKHLPCYYSLSSARLAVHASMHASASCCVSAPSALPSLVSCHTPVLVCGSELGNSTAKERRRAGVREPVILRRRDGPHASVNGFSARCDAHVTARGCASLRRRLPKHVTNNGKVVSCSKLKAGLTRDASASGACTRFAHMCASAEVQYRRSTATTTRELERTSSSSSLFHLSAGLVTHCTRPVIFLACLVLTLRPSPSLLLCLLAFFLRVAVIAVEGERSAPHRVRHRECAATTHAPPSTRTNTRALYQHPSLPLPSPPSHSCSIPIVPWLFVASSNRVVLLVRSPPYADDHARATAPCAFLRGAFVIPFRSVPLTRR